MAVIRGWKFPVQVDKATGKIQTVEDNENIKQSVKIILNTPKFERKIVPDFGADIRSFMFEVVNPNLISSLKKEITTSLNKWEKHIRDLHVSVNTSPESTSQIKAEIDYLTDIEPIQEHITNNITVNDIGQSKPE